MKIEENGNMKNNNTLSYRVGELEKDMKSANKKLDKIMNNELHDLQRAIDGVDAKVDKNSTKYTVATVINLGAILLAAVLLKFL